MRVSPPLLQRLGTPVGISQPLSYFLSQSSHGLVQMASHMPTEQPGFEFGIGWHT